MQESSEAGKVAAPEGYSMQVASRRSGVSPHLIRMWERRYSAVAPERNTSGRRIYTEDAIERLRLLYAATQAGHSIGSIAQLPPERLRSIVTTDAQAASRTTRSTANFREGAPPEDQWVGKALNAIEELHCANVRAALDGALLSLGCVATVEQVIAPLMVEVYERWRNGKLSVAHEHLAASVARTFLGALLEAQWRTDAPLLLVTTLTGQTHEIGALMVAATAAAEGWRALYLGSNMSAEDVAAAVRTGQEKGARALALCFVYPPDNARLDSEVRRLGELLPPEFAVIAGGRAASNYAATLDAIGARRVTDFEELRQALEELRG